VEQAVAGLGGAGKSASFVPEKFSRCEILGQRPNVNVKETLGSSRSIAKDGLRGEFLAGACFASDQDREGKRCNSKNRLSNSSHGVAVSEEPKIRRARKRRLASKVKAKSDSSANREDWRASDVGRRQDRPCFEEFAVERKGRARTRSKYKIMASNSQLEDGLPTQKGVVQRRRLVTIETEDGVVSGKRDDLVFAAVGKAKEASDASRVWMPKDG
jgi:hypothetical protein